jgi:cobalamin biosynthesis Mg chelatase CobN
VLLSVLAVLAMACFPVFAQAEEATGPVYEPEVPTVPSEASTGGGPHGGGSAGISNSPGGNGSGGSGSGTGGGSHNGQGSQAPHAESGRSGSGSEAAGGKVGPGHEVKLGENASSPSHQGESSSSPLVPILIAIVVLAAISIGAYYFRQRRQGAGSSVSPKAS